MMKSGNHWTLACTLALAGCAGAEEGGLELELASTAQELGADVDVSDVMLDRRWPNGVVPYDPTPVLHGNTALPSPPAMGPTGYELWRSATQGAVRFVTRQAGQTPYLRINHNGEDNMTAGKRGVSGAVNGIFDVWFRLNGLAINNPWRVNHELGHVLGFEHQQQHPDHTTCLSAVGANDPTLSHDFFIGDYASNSVMHYPQDPANGIVFEDPLPAGCTKPQWSTHGTPSPQDVDMILRMYGVNGDVLNDTAWCSDPGQRAYVGDFDGDGFDDLLCHAMNGALKGQRFLDYAAGGAEPFGDGDWANDGSFCTGANRTLHVGDFDGDRQSDLMCHNVVLGTRTIDHANNLGELNGKDWEAASQFCWGDDRTLFVGDFDDDDISDHLCHNKALGTRSIDYAKNGFGGHDFFADNAWCTGANQHVLVGDFDGDGGDDLLCHDTSSGARWIDYASSGRLAGTDWSTLSDDRGRSFCTGSSRTLYTGDIDGNGRADLICHNRLRGTVSVDRSHVATRADGSGLWGQNSFRAINFCNARDAELVLARLPAFPGQTSLVCHNRATGHQAVRYAGGQSYFD
jgi:hypothetical protein